MDYSQTKTLSLALLLHCVFPAYKVLDVSSLKSPCALCISHHFPKLTSLSIGHWMGLANALSEEKTAAEYWVSLHLGRGQYRQ